MIDPDRLPDHFDLSFQPGVRKAGTPSGHLLRGHVQQHGSHRAGRCRVADAHFPDDRDLVPLVPQVPYHLHAGLQCLLRLFPRHGGAFRDVSRSGTDPPVDGPFHFGEHAHIDREHIGPGRVSHQVDVARSLRDAAGYQRRHFASGLADPFLNNAVVTAENKRAPLVDPHVRGLRDPGNLNHQILQPAKGMKRLRDAVPAPAGLFLCIHPSASSIRRTTSAISRKRPVSLS